MADIKKAMEEASEEEVVEEVKLTKRQRIIAAKKLQLQRQKRAYGKQPRSLR
jgi:hypothetical protein